MTEISKMNGWWLGFALLISGCVIKPVGVDSGFNRTDRAAFYDLRYWVFEGRIAVASQADSWAANIVWTHDLADERIRLSGPLGQGGVLIHIAENFVSIDRGQGAVRYRDDSDEFVTEQLGFYVPLRSLRFWLVGLVDPHVAFEDIEKGFIQGGWVVRIRQMQATSMGIMPRKIDVSNPDVKLKLMIDQWREHD